MKKQYFILVKALFLTLSPALAQTSLPYYSGFDNATEKSGWVEYRLGLTGLHQWNYTTLQPYSAPESLLHDYPVGASEQTDDWFVSPEFDFSNGATIDSLRYAFTGFGTPMAGDTIALYLLSGSSDPALASSRTILYSFTDSTYINDNVWRKTGGIDIPSVSGKSYLAFRYSTIINWLDVKFDNLGITENNLSHNAFPVNRDLLHIFPNPASDQLNITWEEGTMQTEFAIRSLTGQTIKTFSLPAAGHSLQLDISELPAAFYLLEYADASGKKIVQKFCKG